MKTRIKTNQQEGITLIALFIILFMQSLISNAQAFKEETFYKGFETSFGIRNYKLNSNIKELNQVTVGLEGGRVGVVFGNEIIRATVGLLGYFYSTSSIAGSIDLYENSASANFYPLALLSHKKTRVEPYLVGGISYDRMKFHGYYLNKDQGKINYSASDIPFLGSINQVNSYLGAGIDVKIIDQFDFVHIFSEIKYGINLSEHTKHSEFSGTSSGNQMMINIGVRFGSKN